jgi:O-acetylhomoserine/O-acetylserine sulfhydrylase-like pyridoxal-dependent enzyme
VLVKYEATKEHPAQTEVYQKDVPVGTWSVVNFSSALPSDTKKAMMERARKLKDALKMAREEANMTDVKPVKMGEAIFNWISAAK